MSRERGFGGMGLTDVFVGVSVVAVLAGISLPAISKVRDAAARSSSQDRLCQLTKGLHNFASASPDGSSLPTGNWTDPGYPATGPFAAVLPFVEQLPTTKPATNVLSFTGPADRNNTTRPPGLSDYTFNPAWLGGPAEVWTAGRRPGLMNCPDGTANTILTCEQRADCDGTLNPWHANRGLDGVPGSAVAGTITAAPPGNNFPGVFGRGLCSPDSPSGYHRGLILVAMGDGDVRSVALPVAGSASATAGVTNWQAAVTPAAGDVLGEDW